MKITKSKRSREAFHVALAQEMRAARQAMSITQEQMAKAIGVSRPAVVNMEATKGGAVTQRIGTHRLALWEQRCGLGAGVLIRRVLVRRVVK